MADNENLPPEAAKAVTGKPCAICGKPALQRYKPFCSTRCADIDLGRWLKGTYAIPGESLAEAEAARAEREQED